MKQSVLVYLWKKGYTSRKVADILSTTKDAVLKHAKVYGIKFNNVPKRADTIDYKIVKKLVKKNYSTIQIAKILGCNKSSISRVCKKHNITRCDKFKLTKKEKSIIIGTLLGDASLSKTLNTRLLFTHSLKQEEYCVWKANLLKRLKSKITYGKQYDKRTKKTYYNVCFSTKVYKDLNKFYNLSYVPKKQISEKLLSYYNNLSLAIHFQDDGYKTKNTYMLCTDSFSKQDLHIFNKMCNKKFGIKWVINKRNRLYLPSVYREKFTNLIKPHIHSTLMYKLHL